MAKVIEGLYYSESHEFVRVEGNYGFIGITDYAQNALGNVVYVDMPEVDDEVTAVLWLRLTKLLRTSPSSSTKMLSRTGSSRLNSATSPSSTPSWMLLPMKLSAPNSQIVKL